MARVCTYLNFARNAEEAFTHYKKVFKSEFGGPIMRFGSAPPMEGAPPSPSEADKNLVMHVELPILGGAHTLRGSDTPDGYGFEIKRGNMITINLELDTRKETDRIYKELSEGGTADMPLSEAF